MHVITYGHAVLSRDKIDRKCMTGAYYSRWSLVIDHEPCNRWRIGTVKPRHDFYKTNNGTFPRDGKRRGFELREKEGIRTSGKVLPIFSRDNGRWHRLPRPSKEQWDAAPLLYRPALSEVIRTLFNRNRPETSSYRIYASFDVARLGMHSGEFIRGVYFESGAIWIPNVSRLSSVRIVANVILMLNGVHRFLFST